MLLKYAISALALAGAVLAQTQSGTDSASSTAASSSADATSGAPSGSATPTSTTASAGSGANAKGANAAPTGGANSAAAAAPAGIPNGISATCSVFLNKLNTDSTFASCLAPILSATSSVPAPSGNSCLSASTLSSDLDQLCAVPTCDSTFVRTQLVRFYEACTVELTPATISAEVLAIYDVFYILIPFQKALCAKDSGTYCALKTVSNDTSTSTNNNSGSNSALKNVATNLVTGSDQDLTNSAVEDFQNNGLEAGAGSGSLSRRGQTSLQYAPDAPTFRKDGVMYLFALPSLSAANLCTPCVQMVLKAYAPWEAGVPYGPGLSQSPMLGGQGALWQAATSECGSSFMAPVQAAVGPNAVYGVAGSLSGGTMVSPNIRGGLSALAMVALSAVFAL